MGQHASYALAAQNMQLNQIDCCMLATRGLELVNVATRSTLNVTIGCIAINAYMHWIFIIKRMKSFIRNSHKKAPSQIFERFLNTQRAESREERRKEPFKGLKKYDTFRNLVPLEPFKKREKLSQRSVTSSSSLQLY